MRGGVEHEADLEDMYYIPPDVHVWLLSMGNWRVKVGSFDSRMV